MSRRTGWPPILCFLLVRAVSTLGSMATALAVLVWVQELTGQSGAAALSMLLFALPTLGYPVIGKAVDTYDRARLLIVSQLAGALLTAGFLFVHETSDVWLIYVLQFLQGVNLGLITVSSDALLPGITDRGTLARANGMIQSATQIARLLAPIVGVLCYVRFDGIEAVVILDVVSFAIGAVLLLPVARASRVRATVQDGMPSAHRKPVLGARRAWTGYLRQSRTGIELISTDPLVRLAALTAGCCVLAAGLLGSVWYAVITSGLGQSASFAGVLATTQAAGGIAGGLAGSWFAGTPGRTRPGCRLALVLIGISAMLFLSGQPLLAAVGSAGIGFGGALLVVVYATVIQRSVPEERLGTVFAGMDAMINLLQVAGLAIGAAWLTLAATSFEPPVLIAVLITVLGLVRTFRMRTAMPADSGTPVTSTRLVTGVGRDT